MRQDSISMKKLTDKICKIMFKKIFIRRMKFTNSEYVGLWGCPIWIFQGIQELLSLLFFWSMKISLPFTESAHSSQFWLKFLLNRSKIILEVFIWTRFCFHTSIASAIDISYLDSVSLSEQCSWQVNGKNTVLAFLLQMTINQQFSVQNDWIFRTYIIIIFFR